MRIGIIVAIVGICAACSGDDPGQSVPRQDEPPELAIVRNLARVMGNATLQGDYAKVIDHTFEGIVHELGGRDEAIKQTEAAMKLVTAQGFELKSYEIGPIGDLHAEGDNTFIVVPTEIKMGSPKGESTLNGYLLGISPDAGKTWKFVDGYGMNDDIRERVLPKLPASLVLPRIQMVRK